MLNWLRGLGVFGAYLASALQFIAAWNGVAVSVIVTAAVGYFTVLYGWASSDSVQMLAKVFLFSLWTYIGLSYLSLRGKPQIVKMYHDYAYSLIPDGVISATLAQFEKGHKNAGEDAITVACQFRNISSGPIRVKTEDMRVILDGKTNDHTCIETVFPKLAQKGIRCGAIGRDKTKSNLSGTMEIKLIYGGLEEDYSRRYTLKLEIQIIIDTGSQAISFISDSIKYENDEPIIYR